MAVPFMVVLGVLGSIGKHVLEIPLIHRYIENYCEGTPTWVDGVLWRALEAAASIASPVEREAVVIAQTAKVQIAYDSVTLAAERGEPISHETIKASVLAQALPWIDPVPVEQ